VRRAGESLPPELAHLAEGAVADALAKAVSFARSSVSETTEKNLWRRLGHLWRLVQIT
jgi:hypothetical protein